MQNIAELATAVVLAHSIHSLGEATNVNNKIRRLTDAVNGKKLKPYPANINTRAKAYSLGIGMFLVMTAVFYIVLGLFSLEIETLLMAIVMLIVLVDISGTISFDKFHMAIEKLIKKFDKKGNE